MILGMPVCGFEHVRFWGCLYVVLSLYDFGDVCMWF